MNKKYIGILDEENKVSVRKFVGNVLLENYWMGGFEVEGGFRVIDDLIMILGNDRERVKKKLRGLLVKNS